jgi:hypothetical protein
MKLLPEGLKRLFAPAAALPASVLTPPTSVVVPLMNPVFAEPDAGAPAFVAGREVPVCASAHSLDTARAIASRIVPSFMRYLLLGPKNWCTRRRSQRNVVSQARELIGSSCEPPPNPACALVRSRSYIGAGDWKATQGRPIDCCPGPQELGKAVGR